MSAAKETEQILSRIHADVNISSSELAQVNELLEKLDDKPRMSEAKEIEHQLRTVDARGGLIGEDAKSPTPIKNRPSETYTQT